MATARKPPLERLAVPDDEPEGGMLVASNIGRLRIQRGWSEEMLAERAGLDRKLLASVLVGTEMPPLELLWKIATALRVPVSTLLQPLRRLE